MKKSTKILIALIVIVILAVGAYMLLSPKDTNINMYNKVYSLTYEIKDKENNIVSKVDSAVENMLLTIEKDQISLESEKSNLALYQTLKQYYSLIKEEILDNGTYVNKNSNGSYIKEMNNAYNNLIDIYNETYEYLQENYYSVNFDSLSVATKTTYIKNFNNLFEDINTIYNNFFFNAGLIYAYGTENLIDINNGYKLKIVYYACLVNNFGNNSIKALKNTDNMEAEELLEVSKASENATKYAEEISKINESYFDALDDYIQNKESYDNLIDNIKTLDLIALVEKYFAGEFHSYIAALDSESKQVTATNFVDLVIKG